MQKSITKTVISVRFDLFLWFVIAVAIVVRFWGIGFGMPHDGVRPDEAHIVEIALSFGSGDLNPHDFVYPTFPFYLLFGFYVLYFAFGWFLGRDISPTDFALRYHLDPTHFFIISRSISAILGVATVYLTYRLALLLFNKNKKISVLAAFFLSLAYIHVRDSHFGTVDVQLTFWIVWTMIYVTRIFLGKRELRNYLIAGILAGVATATKYIGLILIAPLFFTHFSRTTKARNVWRAFFDRRLGIFLAGLLLTFLIFTPYSLLDFPKFSSDIFLNTRNLSESWGGIMVGRGWWYHLRFSLFYGLGWSLFLVSLIGILALAIKDPHRAWLLFSFPLIYYVLIGLALTVFVRYVIPLVPFLCIVSAWFIVNLSQRLFSRFGSYVCSLIVFAIAFLITLPSIDSIFKFDRLLIERDNRLIAADWFRLNVKDHPSFYQTRGPLMTIQLPPTIESLQLIEKSLFQSKTKRDIVIAEVARKQIEYFKRENIVGYAEWTFDEKTGKFVVGMEVTDAFPDYIVKQESVLPFGKTLVAVEEIIKQHYVLVQSFVVEDVNDLTHLYDLQDSFYVPYYGFKGIRRPGPNIYIYKRISEV